ncbi:MULTISPECIES: hypothetical protein [Streptomyces]|uniref:Uncharacterized protein n=1 Tax=Streptomyces spororaveus TaxID=284039 RepID=A0ABQ3TH12_9ACTN|nr:MULTISPECIES: hypothetical protein [Streptomyces]MCM9079967.1 hypothetical protein [Streptomyces spororaveus]MCX5305618.1 hypothetical protein [Streptomyces sp. NBC_00160]GHI79689.1 hypothetical protein Sspor_52500 [Streptomyces spororaveus]
MPNSYTTLWTNDLCRWLARGGHTGQRLTMLFGGPHQSLPSFVRAGVRPGDTVVPPELLARLTYTSRRGERTLRHVEDGRLVRSHGVQGIYRLAAGSAAELRQLVLDHSG